MSLPIAVKDLTKMYRMYDRPTDRMKEMLLPGKRKFHHEFWALNGVSFEVGKGEMVGIIGQNGSGKSTLLRIICGVLGPTGGTVTVNGRISALLELGTGFNPEFTGRENVYLSGAISGFSKKDMDGRFEAISEFSEIGGFMDQPVKKYSSGMYVRLAFACAINIDPDILVVDEALAVGDVFFQQKCYRKIAEFREAGKTILLVTHSMDAVQKHCDRAIMLDKGVISASGEPRAVINSYMERVTSRRQHMPGPEAGLPDYNPERAGDRAGRPVDRCKDRPNYSKNEFRYGNSKAAVVDFTLLDAEGKEASFVPGGEEVTFRYCVEFLQPVEKPVYGFMVKTKDGLIVYGTNTMGAGVQVEPGKPGERVAVEFRQRMSLAAGEYFLTAGVAEVIQGDVEAVDRRYDMGLMTVIPADKSFGVVNLFSVIDVRPDGHGALDGGAS